MRKGEMRMPKVDHVHKFMRVSLGSTRVVKDDKGRRHLEKKPGYEVFKCMIPGCKSFMPREIVIGKISQCWNCEKELILDMQNTVLKKPTHEQCRKVREVA
jgi:hypothetical protein